VLAGSSDDPVSIILELAVLDKDGKPMAIKKPV
jgi:hypothetical protein